ncbi:MAG: hypothetical protein ACLGHQ_08960 [Acidimicrobiia bacterium]
MSYARSGQPSQRWQQWVDSKPILSLVIVGVIATQLGTYFGYVFPAVGLPVLPWPLYNGILASTITDGFNAATVIDPETGATVIPGFAVSADSFFMGHSLHFVNGIVFAVLWGVLFREDVARFVTSNVVRGLLYGVVMTIISAGLLVPYAYVPEQGYGLFLFDGPDGWKLPFGILVWHLIYGLFLGLLWNPSKTADES